MIRRVDREGSGLQAPPVLATRLETMAKMSKGRLLPVIGAPPETRRFGMSTKTAPRSPRLRSRERGQVAVCPCPSGSTCDFGLESVGESAKSARTTLRRSRAGAFPLALSSFHFSKSCLMGDACWPET